MMHTSWLNHKSRLPQARTRSQGERVRRAALSCAFALILQIPTAFASYDEAEGFQAASRALQERDTEAAIRELERLADRGTIHPDASYNRGLAYLKRAESDRKKPGDEGQAAAAFAEALLLRPQDKEAAWGLEEARLRVARRASRAGNQSIVNTEPLLDRVLGSFSTDLLFFAAAGGSLLLTCGLLLSLRRDKKTRLSALITSWVGGLILLPSSLLFYFVQRLEEEGSPAVVIAERAPLFDGSGRPLTGTSALPEAQSVHVLEIQGPLARLTSDGGEIWVHRGALRFLAKP